MTGVAPSVAVVGTGRVAQALVLELGAARWPVAGIVGRTAEASHDAARRLGVDALGSSASPRPGFDAAPWVLLAVRDRDLAPLAVTLAARDAWPGRVVLHVSGALCSDVLEPLALHGAETGSFHPLLSLRGDERAGGAFADADVFGEGSPSAELAGAALATALGARWRRIEPELKPLYHAAATIAGNLVPAACAAAARLLRERGLDDLERPLARLAESALEGVALHRGPGGLTGPIARGDVETLRANVRALASLDGEDAIVRHHAAGSLLAIDELRRAGRPGHENDERLDAMEALLRAVLERPFR